MDEKADVLQIIKETFDPKLITALFKNFSDQYNALDELIDNTVDDIAEGKKLAVFIDYDPENQKLTIKNHNGNGMDSEDLVNYFRWGQSGKKSRIGRYGQGGKAAIGYLAKSFVIKSHPAGSQNGYSIQVDDWENRESGFKEFKIETFSSIHDQDVGAVSIEVSKLKKTFRDETIKERIRKTYRPLIVEGKIDFFVDQVKVNCDSINYDEGTRTNFEFSIDLDGTKYPLRGEYGMVSDPKSIRGGFRVYQYGRCVAEKEYFGHLDPSKRWNVERLSGELDIDFDVPLTMNKADIDRDSRIWVAIMNRMHEMLKSVMPAVIDYRSPTTQENRVVKDIEKKIRKEENTDEINLDFTSYGPNLLFKVVKTKDGRVELKINRDHKAYIKWHSTSERKDTLYMVMIYALFDAIQQLPKKEAAHLLDSFSEALRDKSDKYL